MTKRVIYFLLILIWMCLIFGFSSQNGDDSKALSNIFTNRVVADFFKGKEESELREIHNSISFIVRKIAHFSIYFLGGVLIFGFINTFDLSLRNKIILTIIFGFLYAMTDELHQKFVNGRSGELRDVLIDTSGIIIATFVRAKISQIINRKKT